MQVDLKSTWFDPSATLRPVGVQEVPDEWEGDLPSSAVILGDDGKPRKLKRPKAKSVKESESSEEEEKEENKEEEKSSETPLKITPPVVKTLKI